MVRNITFVLVLITFFSSHILFEKLIKKHGSKIKFKHVGIISIALEALMVFLAAHITFFFYVLIYGTIIIASFITVYSRTKQSENKIFRDAI